MEKLDANPAVKTGKPKKKHTALVILIVFFSVIILLFGGAYAFLSLTQFDAGSVELADYLDAPYTGEAELKPGGTLSALLKEADIYWIAAKNGVEDALKQLPKEIELSSWHIKLVSGGADIYAAGKACGFIPLSVKVNVGLAASADAKTITATPNTVMLGKYITLGADKLYQFGLQPSYMLYTNSMGFSEQLKAMEFTADGVKATEQLLGEPFERLTSLAYAKANETYIFSGDDMAKDNPLYVLSATSGGKTVSAREIFAKAAQTGDYVKALCRMAALCEKEQAEFELKAFNEFDRHFFLNWTAADEQAARESYSQARISGQRDYESALTALREKYKAMELTLDTGCILDNATGGELKLSALPGGERFNDETSRVLLLNSFDAARAAMTDDMPPLNGVPATSVKVYRDEYYMRPYDLGILFVLPTGEPAVIYFNQNGNLMLNFATDAFYEKRMSEELLQFATTDLLPHTGTHEVLAAPADGLNDCEIVR